MPSAVVQDLEILLDMLMSSHVKKTVSTCFAVLRHLRSILRSVSQSLVTSLVLSRLDYCIAYRDTGRYSSTSSSVASVSDECSCSTNLLIVKVWLHHSAPTSTSLIEGKGTNRFQICSNCVEMCRHTSPMNLKRPADSPSSMQTSHGIVIYTGHPSNLPYDHGWSVISSCFVTRMEQSSTARHCLTFPSSL